MIKIYYLVRKALDNLFYLQKYHIIIIIIGQY